MVDISRETYERNDIKTIIDMMEWNMWLNKKHIEEGLDHKNLTEFPMKYHSDHRKSRYESNTINLL